MTPSENRTPAELRERRRNLVTAGGTLAVLAALTVGMLLSQPLHETPVEEPVSERSPVGNPQAQEDAEMLVVDVDRDGNLQIDGRPTRLDSLRDTLEGWRGSAQQVLVTIRADERCRYYHVRQVIRACDDFAVAEYKVQPLPEDASKSL